MKRDSGPSLADRLERELTLWCAEIEIAHVRFHRNDNTAIEFRSEIDAWMKMEVNFRSQIKALRSSGKKSLKGKALREYKDLETMVYSIRDKLD